MGVISIANSNDGDHFSLLFWRWLDFRYQTQFYSTWVSIDGVGQAWT